MTASDLLAALIILAAALLTVITGFGFVVLSAPLLAYLYDPLRTVYLAVLLSTVLLGILLLSPGIRRVIRWGLVARLSLWAIAGLPLGLLIVPYLNESQFRMGLGLITLAYVAFRLWGRDWRLGYPRVSVVLAGILGGAFSTSSGMSALPVIFLAGDMHLDAFEHRATLAGYVFFTGLTSLAAFHLAGTAQTLRWLDVGLLGPALVLGMLGGSLLVRRLSERQLAVGVLIYLAVNGLIAILPL